MSPSAVLEQTCAAHLRDFAFVRAWGGRAATGFVRYLEAPGAPFVLRVEVDPIRHSAGATAYRADPRPPPEVDPQSYFAAHAYLASFDWADDEELGRRLAIVFQNVARFVRETWTSLEERWRGEFDSGDEERDACRAKLPEIVRSAFWPLDPDLDKRLLLGAGWCVRERKVPAHFSRIGHVPGFVRLELVREDAPNPDPHLLPAPPVRLEDYRPAGSLVSNREFAELARAWLDHGAAELTAGRRWSVLGPPASLEIVPGPRLVPSRELVLRMNRRPRFAAFSELIEPLDEATWRELYEGAAMVETDGVQHWKDAITKDPSNFAPYKQLADALVARNDRAAADLWLGLGYLRAHRTLGIARAKLESARKQDPLLPGLAEAFAELAAAAGA